MAFTGDFVNVYRDDDKPAIKTAKSRQHLTTFFPRTNPSTQK